MSVAAAALQVTVLCRLRKSLFSNHETSSLKWMDFTSEIWNVWSKESFCNTEPSQAGASFTSAVADGEALTPGFHRNLPPTKLETANLWNTVLSTFFLEFAFSK